MRNQAVANGQQRVNATGVAQRQTVLANANGQAADQVDEQNQQAGNGVTADEFGGTVHGAEEVRLLRQLSAAGFGGFLVDHAGIEVGVDGHLLAGHGVQRKAGVDLGDAACALGHHKEVHDHQDRENNETHHVVATNDELAKGGHHLACSLVAFVAVDQNHAGGRHIERQAQHGGKQQHRRKGRKFEWFADLDGDHDDQHARRNIEGEQDVQHHRVQRNHQHAHDQQDQRRNAQVIEVELRQVLSNV